MKTLVLAVLLIASLALPVFAITYTGYDSEHLFNGVYDDWTLIGNPYGVFDMGSPTPISSIGVHERTGGGLVYDLQLLFSNDGYTGFASGYYEMDLSNINHPAELWAFATFEPVTARYCQVFIDSNGTYIQADEVMINWLDGAGNPVPEPTSFIALAFGITTLGFLKRKRQSPELVERRSPELVEGKRS